MTETTLDMPLIADWLAVQFLTPPDEARIAALCSEAGQQTLTQIGEDLGCPSAVKRLKQALFAGSSQAVTTTLQHHHVALFEGVFRRHRVPPYASLWDGTGRLFGPAAGRMQKLLRDLDMRVAAGGNQPADHLGIQLAALAEAMRRDDDRISTELIKELAWTERFSLALIKADGAGFYAGCAQILTAFLDKASHEHGLDTPAVQVAS